MFEKIIKKLSIEENTRPATTKASFELGRKVGKNISFFTPFKASSIVRKFNREGYLIKSEKAKEAFMKGYEQEKKKRWLKSWK